MKLCKLRIHSYRHVALLKNPLLGLDDIIIGGEPRSWDHHEQCKSCGRQRISLVWKIPYSAGAAKAVAA
jgi:hypothetical protein